MFADLIARTSSARSTTPRYNAKAAYGAATQGAQATGATADNAYLQRALAFDPYKAAETSAQGQYASFYDSLKRDLGTERGNEAAMGRIDSGWAQQGEDELISGGLRDLNQRVMMNATNAAGMDMANTQGLGSFGTQRTGMFYDLLAGQLDRETAERNSKRQSRAAMVSGIAQGAGALAGMFL